MTTSSSDGALLFDQAEAARRLGTSVRWILDHRHEIPYVRIGRSRMYTQELLDRFIARQTVDPYAPSARSMPRKS